jgi:hypothetical protein
MFHSEQTHKEKERDLEGRKMPWFILLINPFGFLVVIVEG